MLLAIAAVLVLLWLVGLVLNIVGGIIHIVLVVGLIVLVFHFVKGRRSA